MPTIEDLPLEVLRLVMDYFSAHADLQSCLLVNHCFYGAAIPAVWHTPREMGKNVPESRQLGLFHDFGSHVRHISFGPRKNARTILKLLSHTPLLTDLTLVQAPVMDHHVEAIVRQCPALQRIKFDRLEWISGRSLTFLAHCCSQLTDLSLADCSELSPGSLLTNGFELGQKVKRLTLGSKPVPLAAHPHPSLFSFGNNRTMSGHRARHSATGSFSDYSSLPSEGGNSFSELSELCIWGHNGVTDARLITFLRTHSRLLSLSLKSCLVTKDTLATIATFLPDIQTLDLAGSSGLRFRHIRKLVENCPNLASVALTNYVLSRQFFQNAGVLILPLDNLRIECMKVNPCLALPHAGMNRRNSLSARRNAICVSWSDTVRPRHDMQ